METIKLFYDEALLKFDIAESVPIELDSYPHFLVVGGTGSGKTSAVKYMLGKISLALPDM